MTENKKKKKFQENRSKITKRKLVIPDMEKKSIVPLVIAFLLPLILYFQTVNFGFTRFDDSDIILNNLNFLSDFGNARKAFLTDAFIDGGSKFYRPLQTLSYMIDIQFSGHDKTWMFHLTNILLLGAITYLFFLLLLKFSIPRKLSLTGALIYCVHPLFVSSIAWIPARGDLLLTFFTLLSFLFFIEFMKNKKYLSLFINWTTFSMALFSKETAAFVPLIFVVYFLFFVKDKHFDKKNILFILLYSITGICWYWLRSVATMSVLNPNDSVGFIPILLNLRIIPEALTKFFIPLDFAPIAYFSLFRTFAGVSIIIAISIIIIKKRESIISKKIFCLLWFLILMIPPMIFKSNLIDYLDHRFFLPLIGILMFLLFMFPSKWLEKGDLKISWIVVLVFLFLCSFTFIKSRDYNDPMTYFNSAINHNSNSAISYILRGNIKSETNDLQGAIDDYNKGISIYDNEDEAFNDRGLAKAAIGDKTGAISDYDKAILINPNNTSAFNNRGTAKSALTDEHGAIEDFNKAIALHPKNVEAYNNRGIAKAKLNDNHAAIDDFNKVVEIDPSYAQVYINRAIAKYTIKDLEGAISDCEISLKLNPNDEMSNKLKIQAQQELMKFKN